MAGRLTPALWREIERQSCMPKRKLAWLYSAVCGVDQDGVPGDLVECGVWRGGSAGLLGLATTQDRRLWLFDSFEGLPEPTEEDVGERRLAGRDVAELVRAGPEIRPVGHRAASMAQVESFLFGRCGLEPHRVIVTRGWFQDTLPGGCERIALLHVDGDWYESTRVCLGRLYDLVSPGGWVGVDDFAYWPGCRRAVREHWEGMGGRPECVEVGTAVWWRKEDAA